MGYSLWGRRELDMTEQPTQHCMVRELLFSVKRDRQVTFMCGGFFFFFLVLIEGMPGPAWCMEVI